MAMEILVGGNRCITAGAATYCTGILHTAGDGAMLGAGRLRTFFRIILPLSIPGVITALVLSFAHTLGEFGVVLMVGGNLPGVTRTVSIDIYDRAQSLDYAGASQTALLLLLLSFAVLATVYGINRSSGGRAMLPRAAK
jgi:ABC-type molybdate transport system permease subunit